MPYVCGGSSHRNNLPHILPNNSNGAFSLVGQDHDGSGVSDVGIQQAVVVEGRTLRRTQEKEKKKNEKVSCRLNFVGEHKARRIEVVVSE